MPHKCIGKSEVVSSLFCLCYVSVVSMFHCFCLPNSKSINKRKLIPCNEISLHNVRYSINKCYTYFWNIMNLPSVENLNVQNYIS